MAATTGEGYPPELIESMTALSSLVLADEDVSSTVARISDLAVHAIEGAEVCSISFVRKGEIATLASTDDIGVRVDQIQYAVGEGPCLSSIDKEQTFHIADMERDETWPTFSKRIAEETGTKSMLSYVLRVDEGALGAVNLTSSKVESFSKDDVAIGSLFAAQAGIALANALTHEADQDQIHQLEEGMRSRQMIGQAVGLVMASHQVDAEEGFQLLVRISQHTNVKLRTVAQRLVDNPTEA